MLSVWRLPSNQISLNSIKYDHGGIVDETVLVFDVGKSRSKLHLVNRRGQVVITRFRDNLVSEFKYGQALDTDGIARWLKDQLRELSQLAWISTIVPVAHGAAAALMTGDERIRPVLDYETHIPEDIAIDYGALRGPFEETLSPRLPQGLNLGTQLFWQDRLYPELGSPESTIFLWPQYWTWWLSGARASEYTSLGCHTDLWRPLSCAYSQLTFERQWDRRLPTLTRASEVVGTIRPELARDTGLDPKCSVLCGMHDSNAALYALRAAHRERSRDISIVSTGTWFVAMRVGAEAMPVLNPQFDTLANVDVDGRPVPTARFMGGRAYETIVGADELSVSGTRDGVMRLVERGAHKQLRYDAASGQFVVPPSMGAASRADLAALHLALNTDAALRHIGARGPVIVEGRFAHNEAYVSTLAALRSPNAVDVVVSGDGVAFGGARLAWPEIEDSIKLECVSPAAVELGEIAMSDGGEGHVEGN